MSNSVLLLVLLSILAVVAVALAFLRLALPKFVSSASPATTSVTSSTLTTSSGFARSISFVKLVVLVDNYPNPQRPDLQTAWGVSIYVETPSARILFDTGPDPEVLKHNAEVLGIDLSKIDAVVISHEHFDHVGGLPLIAKLRPGLPVYIPAPSSYLVSYVKRLGLEPRPVDKTIEIAPGVYVLKPLYGPPWEDALAIKTGRGIVLLVGCSHPGITNIVEEAMRELGNRVYMVIGGFHMAGYPLPKVKEVVEKLLSLGVEKIYPIHCSGDTIRHYLETHYPEHYGDGHVGLEIVIDSGKHHIQNQAQPHPP